MTGRIDIPVHLADETIQPLEYSTYTLWAEALGLKQLLRNSDPAEIDACRFGLLEAARLILSEMEQKK